MEAKANSLTPEITPFLDAFSSRVAILDEASRLVALNKAWRAISPTISVAAPFRELLSGFTDAQFVTEAVCDVLEGRRQTFQFDYSLDGKRPYSRRLIASLLRQNTRVYAVIVDDICGDLVQERAALRFETLLAEAAAAFIRAPADEIDSEINQCLQRAGEMLELDRATAAQVDPDAPSMLIATHQWQRAGVSPVPYRLNAAAAIPWATARMLAGEITAFDNTVAELPEEASKDREYAIKAKAKSSLWIPLRIGGKISGGTAFGTVFEERHWAAQTIKQLSRLTEIFGIALERQQSSAMISKLRDESQAILRTVPMAEITASLAHELNQPLGAILNNAQASRRLLNAKRAYHGDVKEAMEAIIGDVGRATDTIRHTREIFQLASDDKVVLDIRQLILDVENMLRGDARTRGISLQVRLPLMLPPVFASRQGLLQALLNLVLNAFEAVTTRPRGSREVVLQGQCDSKEVQLRITDSGPGIEPELRAQLFNAFVTSKPNGTGMGLAIVRSIVDKNGGRVWLEETSDFGTSIRFSLPIYDANASLTNENKYDRSRNSGDNRRR